MEKIINAVCYIYDMKHLISVVILFATLNSYGSEDSLMMRKISDEIMLNGKCYEDLRVLCKDVGHRLSGSPQAEKAVKWGEEAMKEAGADKVWLQPVDVPHWVRGNESLKFKYNGQKKYQSVQVLSLGNSIGTDGKILEGMIIKFNSFDEYDKAAEEDIKGNIVFFNYRFRQDFLYPFHGYGDAGPYRWHGPNKAAAKGAKALIIRSVSTGLDDYPHTGAMRYADSIQPIPAVAIGNTTADILEQECEKGTVEAQLMSECKMLDPVRSYNVIGEITGSKYPNKIVVVGGHLDSWDVGDGAHDDGAGCVQSIEVIRAFKKLGIQPEYTVRAVLFMNEENGLKGGYAYDDSATARGEEHIFALESDAGGFSPRGFGLDMDDDKKRQIRQYKDLFEPYGIYDFKHQHGGADISPLHRHGVPASGLSPDPQRYFDLHHTAADVFEEVNHRELKLGAVAMTQMIYLVSKYGLK